MNWVWGGLWTLLIFGAGVGYALSAKDDLKDWARPAVPIALAVAAVVSQRWINTRSKIASGEQTLADFIIALLDDAVARITNSIENEERDSLEWLTAARSIRTALIFAEKVTDPTAKAVLEEKILLRRLEVRQHFIPSTGPRCLIGMPITFYAERERDFIYQGGLVSATRRAPLHEASLVEIYRFAQWPEGRQDVLPISHCFTDHEIEQMGIGGPRNLANLMTFKREFERNRDRMPDNRKILDFEPMDDISSEHLVQARLNEKLRQLDSSSPDYCNNYQRLMTAANEIISFCKIAWDAPPAGPKVIVE